MSMKSVILATVVGSYAAGGAVAFAQAPTSSAPANPFAGMVRFGGTITRADGRTFSIRSQDGGETTLMLTEKPNIMISAKGSMADLAAGKFVGCTAVKGADNLLHATECHIFPEAMRGMGEGHNPMGPPNTTMTNGNVATMANGEVTSRSGDATATLHVTYKGGEQIIQVGTDANITRISAGTAAMIKPGAKAMGAGRPAADGSTQVGFLSLTP